MEHEQMATLDELTRETSLINGLIYARMAKRYSDVGNGSADYAGPDEDDLRDVYEGTFRNPKIHRFTIAAFMGELVQIRGGFEVFEEMIEYLKEDLEDLKKVINSGVLHPAGGDNAAVEDAGRMYARLDAIAEVLMR